MDITLKTVDEMRVVFLLFNKTSGIYTHQISAGAEEEADELERGIDLTYFKVKRVKMIPSRHIWVGDYDSGSIKLAVDERPKVSEYTLNASAKNKIGHVYKNHKQVNVVRKALIALVRKLEMEGSEEFQELFAMTDVLDGILDNNKRYKESYKNHPSYDYLDKKAFMEEVSKTLDGGLAQVVGRPQYAVEYDWDS